MISHVIDGNINFFFHQCRIKETWHQVESTHEVICNHGNPPLETNCFFRFNFNWTVHPTPQPPFTQPPWVSTPPPPVGAELHPPLQIATQIYGSPLQNLFWKEYVSLPFFIGLPEKKRFPIRNRIIFSVGNNGLYHQISGRSRGL